MALCLEVQTFDAQQEGSVIRMREERLALLPERQSSVNPSIDHRLLTAGGRIANPRTDNVEDTTSAFRLSRRAYSVTFRRSNLATCADAGTVWYDGDLERQPPPPPPPPV
ncbi:hypothetical protein BKA70DRAFT_1427706 [Coprinopsis sp. MPI-PUGE-AT-0042]|nr:hypothetical protein BKA70DRAFT_1427706 [Coprinopsis sp. MPI-PUGE-AT-0042]